MLTLQAINLNPLNKSDSSVCHYSCMLYALVLLFPRYPCYWSFLESESKWSFSEKSRKHVKDQAGCVLYACHILVCSSSDCDGTTQIRKALHLYQIFASYLILYCCWFLVRITLVFSLPILKPVYRLLGLACTCCSVWERSLRKKAYIIHIVQVMEMSC